MLYKRHILNKIEKVINRDEFIILTGARQTGKTSVLALLKSSLEKKGEICNYFNLENTEVLKVLNKHPYNIFELIPKSRTKQYIFIDEVQYLDNPTNFLKLLYDEKRNEIKIIASGSSSFYIDKKFKDSLVGRKFLFEIYPLNFEEFLIFHQEEELLEQKNNALSAYYKNMLLELWEKYLTYGGYPKVVLAENEDLKKIMLEEIGTSYIKKDIRDAGVRNMEKYFSLLRILAGQTGQLVNWQELANTLGVARKTIEEYSYIVEKSYHAAFVNPFYRNIRKEITKMPKVYFYDTGLRNFFLNNYEKISRRTDKGQYLENVFFREFLAKMESADKIKFWRTQDKKEIDFIVENEAYEIKFSRADKINERKYEKFREKYPEIKLNFLSYDDILEKFYRWKL